MPDKTLSISQALDLALKFHNQGKLEDAEQIYKHILELEQNPDCLHLLGLISYQKADYPKALNNIQKALSIKKDALFCHNLAMVYDALNNEQASTENFQKALSLSPNYPDSYLAYYNLGISHKDKLEFDQALEYFNKSLEQKDFPDARWNKALILLSQGKIKEAWPDFEYRFKKQSPTDSRVFNKPKWNGENLDGKRILVLSEQGFGDDIQFSRYLELLKQQGAKIIFECKPQLRKLFENHPYIDELIEKNKSQAPVIEYDFYIHLMSLPGLLDPELNSPIHKTPYLTPDPELIKNYESLFNTKDFKLGICWQGNPKQDNDKNRSTTLENFKTLKTSGIKLYSLQKNIPSNDQEILDLELNTQDFADTAALMHHLDLIISVDTSIAHLAAALNKPIWNLLPNNADWRWFNDPHKTKWYPSMKLFRKKPQQDWNSLFQEIKKELNKVINHRIQKIKFP